MNRYNSVSYNFKEKCDQLKNKFLKQSGKTKAEVIKYLKDTVGLQWTEFHNQRLKFEASLSQNHEVDIAREYGCIKRRLQKLDDEGLARLAKRDLV